jgi:hypothetical protein
MALLNRLLMMLLGLALVVLGVLIVAEAVADAAGAGPLLVDPRPIGSTFRELSWGSPELLPVWVSLIAIGVVLLLLEAIPRTPAVLPLPASGDGRHADVSRRSVAAVLTDVAQDDEGVRSARVDVRPRVARVDVVARPGAETRTVRERVERSVAERLDALQLGSQIKPRVSVTRSRERK